MITLTLKVGEYSYVQMYESVRAANDAIANAMSFGAACRSESGVVFVVPPHKIDLFSLAGPGVRQIPTFDFVGKV